MFFQMRRFHRELLAVAKCICAIYCAVTTDRLYNFFSRLILSSVRFMAHTRGFDLCQKSETFLSPSSF